MIMINLNSKTIKIISAFISLLITIICAVASLTVFKLDFSYRIFGAFGSLILIILLTYKLPNWFYILALFFHFFASSLGTIFNMYANVPFYDDFVHYLSGVVLAAGGYLVSVLLFNKYKIAKNKFILLTLTFLFSSACAAFWEIYEFSADQIFGTLLQGDNLNTMGDIVAGVLGGLTYCLFLIKRKTTD